LKFTRARGSFNELGGSTPQPPDNSSTETDRHRHTVSVVGVRIPQKLVGASARGPAFSWVHYSRRLRRLYSCAAPHILISPAFHTIVLALRAAIYCGRTDGLTRDTTATDRHDSPASHSSSTQLKAGIQVGVSDSPKKLKGKHQTYTSQ